MGNKEKVYTHLSDLLIDQGRLPEAQKVLSMLKEEEYFEFIRRDAKSDNRTTRIESTSAEKPWEERYLQKSDSLAKIGKELSELKQKAKLGLNDDEKKREAERLMKVLDKARAMSDKDFELNGPDLAKEFISESKKNLEKDKELQKELEKIHQERRGGPSRTGRILINPKIMPILEKRLELMKNAKQLPPADLDKIKSR